MPLTRKQQVLAKLETSEGSDAMPGASDAILVYDPSISPSVEVQDRVPAGPTLSRDFAPVGRETLEVAFSSDFRGSGLTGTAPDWGAALIQAAGWKPGTLVELTTGAVTGIGFQVGEIVQQSAGAIRGVIVGILESGAPVHRTIATGALLAVAEIVGTFTPAATTGESSASTSTLSAVDVWAGFTYQPTSEKLINITTAAWSGGTPAAEGETMAVENGSGQQIGAVQIINDNGSFLDMDVTLLFGSIANGDTLRNAAGTGTTTVNAAPVAIRTPSLSLYHNFDGRLRKLLGGRGDFTCAGEAGAPLVFAWTFSGDATPGVDTPAIATTGLSTVRPPRLFGAICSYGLDDQVHRLPTKSISVANGATVAPNLDANRPGGATGSNVTDRDPTITVTVDQVHGAFDWEAAQRAGTVVRAAFLLGTTAGNMLSIVAPRCQVREIAIGDAEGVATFDVTLAVKRIRESGDDEMYFTQL